jgi:lipopolysaccharide export system protein LptA
MLRARFPVIAKALALTVFLGVGGLLGTQLVKRMNAVPPTSKIKPNLDQAKLTAEFNNFKYDYHEGHTRYRLTAAKDKVFSNSRHELEKVKLELFDQAGEPSGQVTSDLCNYDQSQAILKFQKNVVVSTKDGLEVKTESLDYNQNNGNAETTEKVDFTRERINGNCIGAILESQTKRLEMKQAVYIKVEPAKTDGKNPESVSKPVEITGDWAEYTGDTKKINLRGNAKLAEPDRSLSAANMIAYLTDDKKIQKVEARGGSHLQSQRGDSLILDAVDMNFFFDGAGKLSQTEARGKSYLESNRADSSLKVNSKDMDFSFDSAGKISNAKTRGQSHLEHKSLPKADSKATKADTSKATVATDNKTPNKAPNQFGDSSLNIDSENMEFFFDPMGNLSRAEAQENVKAETTSSGPARILMADNVEVFTKATATGTEIERIKAKGNVNLKVAAPAPTQAVPNPANKELKAAEAEVFYYPGGQFLREAQAHGQTVLTITPVENLPGAEKRIMRAEHNTLTFFEANNAVRELNAQGKVKLEVETVPKNGTTLPVKITESDKAKAYFDKTSGEITQAIQEGNFKYEEGTQHALANKANYDATKKLIELREGKVVVWDEKGRTQADEIDLLTEKQESFARGKVRTTYYNPETTGQATPFRNTKAPVFITAKELHAFNKLGQAIYTGDARAWQDDNFVRSDKLELFRNESKMIATGNVSSALYQAKKSVNDGKNNQQVVPIFATSDAMNYSDKERLAEYKGAVKMRQAEETLEANKVKIFLEPDINELNRLEAFEKVVLIQPGRRGEADEAEYTSQDQRTILTGNMARVVSDLQGTVTGRRLTLLGGDDRIFVDDQRGIRRVKSTHEVQR